MRAGLQEDERLVRFTKICLGFPQAEREVQGSHASFKIKKKTFAYFWTIITEMELLVCGARFYPEIMLRSSRPTRNAFTCQLMLDQGGGWDFGWMLAE
jgi:hypothetical protein